jgi:N-methylhydantoinase A
MLKIGIDTGGTFTDFIVLDGAGVRTLKLLSTPANPAAAILHGLQELARDLDELEILLGSTVATNALIERKGAKTALVTTKGFEDVLEIGRQNRPRIYSLFPSRPEPLVPRRFRLGITERTLYDGTVLITLKTSELPGLERFLRRHRIESLAVCLLFSYANPAHEKQIGRFLRNLNIPISLSHLILPEFREFERTSTTVVNAYLAPLMGRYLGKLERSLRSRPSKRQNRLRIMQSNGGAVPAAVAVREPVRTILSGPAGGVAGAWHAARLAGFRNILSFDMGGTSTDVSLCEEGIRITSESVIADCPVSVPVIDIHTVGAGGGSIARVDEGGALRVGPESAGADPGPICYGRGDRITVTDANLYLGKLAADYPLGGTLYLKPDRLEAAFQSLGRETGAATPLEAAQGVIDVANANMEAALRVISVERGHDPRDFVLVTFGGAGGLHAAALAASLSIPKILIPSNPGLLSALGVLLADNVRDFSKTLMLRTARLDTRKLEAQFAILEAKGSASLRREGYGPDQVRLERWMDMRYRGQSFELSLPFSQGYEREFHRRHEKRYGYADASRESEIVTIRVRAAGISKKPRVTAEKPGTPDPGKAFIHEKDACFEGKIRRTRIYERERLRAGNRIEGPALVFEYSASTAVPPGFRCEVDRHRNLVLTKR